MATNAASATDDPSAAKGRETKATEEWLRPLAEGDDTSEWETIPMPANHPRGPRGSYFTVDLDAEQTAWLYRQSGAAGMNPIDLLKKLVDDARSGGA